MAQHDPSLRHSLGLADRVELGVPQGYWEENLADGRRAALLWLIDAMAPLAGRRVIDPFCGWGSVARLLHSGGARVVASAPSKQVVARARRRRNAEDGLEPSFVVTAEPLGAFRPRSFDDVVLIEPGALADDEPRDRFLQELDDLEAERVFLVLRVSTRWNALAGGGERESLPSFDFTTVLREIHLATRYRLVHSIEEKRRNSALRLATLRAVDL